MTLEGSTHVRIEVDKNTYERRWELWRKNDVRRPDGKLEFLNRFDLRVYKLGLIAIQKHVNEKERKKEKK